MKYLFILLLLPCILFAQPKERKFKVDDQFVGYTIQPSTVILCYTSGFFKGYFDVLNYHYPQFKAIHPNADDQWWNPDLAWRNKYKNGDPTQGAAFLGSTTIFVDLTAADHLVNGLSKYTMIAAITIKIGEKNKPLKFYLMDAFIYTVAWNAGFWTTYEFIYRPPKQD